MYKQVRVHLITGLILNKTQLHLTAQCSLDITIQCITIQYSLHIIIHLVEEEDIIQEKISQKSQKSQKNKDFLRQNDI
jgi:hypothetical protein